MRPIGPIGPIASGLIFLVSGFWFLVYSHRSMLVLHDPLRQTDLPRRCIATIGAVSNPDNMNISIGKAGRTRWMGRRGHVRGEVMNPVDHPLGGRTRGGRHPVTPWGKPTKGMKTRKNKRTAKFIMASRHARKQK